MTRWHVPADVLAKWVSGDATLTVSMSVEKHLEGCRQCQEATGRVVAVSPEGIDFAECWDAIAERVEPQSMGPAQRLLMRLGVSEESALLTVSSASLRRAWFTAVTLVTAFSLIVSQWDGQVGAAVFWLAAPLLPMAGVAASYEADDGAMHELLLTTPYPKLRLLLMRSAAVLVVSVPLSMVAAVPLGGAWWQSIVWLLPALAFVSLTLAAATVTEPRYAAITIGAIWTVLSLPQVAGREPVDLTSATALVVYAVLGTVGLAVVTTRSHQLSTEWRLR